MKKVLLVAVLALTVVLSGCTTELETKLEDLETLQNATSALANENQRQHGLLKDAVDAQEERLEAEIAELEAELKTANSRIKNALNRDTWATRKVKYNPDYSSYEAEYCFGIFDEDWTTEASSDYTHNTGLKFVITIEQVIWGTEVLVKDSCGNYSDFIYAQSPYGLYSVPADFFEEGETYEVVLYKETYFTTDQLGLLPLADMAAYGQYPEDITGIVSTKLD